MLAEYDELIQKLRNAGKESFLFGDLMRDAANVIEELSAEEIGINRGTPPRLKYNNTEPQTSGEGSI